MARQRADQQTEAVDRDQRATRFQASLTRDQALASERAAAGLRGQQAQGEKLKPKTVSSTASSAEPNQGHKPDKSDKTQSGPGRAGDRDDKARPEISDRDRFGLTGEQAAVLDSLAGPGGVDQRKPRAQGQGMEGDDLAVGGAGGPGNDVRAHGASGKSAGEDAIAEVAAAVSAAAASMPGQAWLRPEGPVRQETRSRDLPQLMPGVDPIHQLYIGRGPAGAEARMMITTGPLAGSEIRLREGPGGVIAQIITQNASSRQTLQTAMAAVAERLKAKGQRLEVKFEQAGSEPGPGSEQPGSSGRFDQPRPRK